MKSQYDSSDDDFYHLAWPKFPRDEVIIMSVYKLTERLIDVMGDKIELFNCQIFTPNCMSNHPKILCRFDENTWIDVVNLGLKKDEKFNINNVPLYYRESEPVRFENKRLELIAFKK